MRQTAAVERNEDGAILMFALIFLTVVALMVTVLLRQADGGFLAADKLRQVQSVQYAADAAVQEAMSSLGTTTNYLAWPAITNPPTTGACPTALEVPSNINPVTMNGFTIQANCTYLSSLSHEVEISACAVPGPGLAPSVRDCPAPLLRADVTVSQRGNGPVYLTINDWSVLDQGNS